MLIELIKLSKENDENSTLELINKFYPLVKKYANKLYYDNYESYFYIQILIAIKKFNTVRHYSDAEIVCYFSKVIRNAYIDEIKRKKTNIPVQSYENIREIEKIESKNNDILNMEHIIYINQITTRLTDNEKRVIIELFVNNKSENELAKELSISKQAISNTKRKALKKIKLVIKEV